jgi:hypothetical protein
MSATLSTTRKPVETTDPEASSPAKPKIASTQASERAASEEDQTELRPEVEPSAAVPSGEIVEPLTARAEPALPRVSDAFSLATGDQASAPVGEGRHSMEAPAEPAPGDQAARPDPAPIEPASEAQQTVAAVQAEGGNSVASGDKRSAMAADLNTDPVGEPTSASSGNESRPTALRLPTAIPLFGGKSSALEKLESGSMDAPVTGSDDSPAVRR